MNIVFMGTPLFAKIIFEELQKHHNILAVFTQPDKPVGRKAILTPPIMKIAALESHIQVFQPAKLDAQSAHIIQNLKPEAIIVVAYGKILPKTILDSSMCINVHASILPKYRGASPIQQMILSNDTEFGISIIQMEEELDSGDILALKSIPRIQKNIQEVSLILAHLGASALLEVLANLKTIKPIPQDSSKATYCPKITKEDGIISFDNADIIFKKSLAFEQWPGISLQSGVKLFGIDIHENTSTNTQGKILSINPCIIGCLKGSISIQQIQAPSKQRVNASDYLRGRQLKINNILQ